MNTSNAYDRGSGSAPPPPASNNKGEGEGDEVDCNYSDNFIGYINSMLFPSANPKTGLQSDDDSYASAVAGNPNPRHRNRHEQWNWNTMSKYVGAAVVLALVAFGTGTSTWGSESQIIKVNKATAIKGKSSRGLKGSENQTIEVNQATAINGKSSRRLFIKIKSSKAKKEPKSKSKSKSKASRSKSKSSSSGLRPFRFNRPQNAKEKLEPKSSFLPLTSPSTIRKVLVVSLVVVGLCALGVKKFGLRRKGDDEDEADNFDGVRWKVAPSAPTLRELNEPPPTACTLPEGQVAASAPQQQSNANAGSAPQQKLPMVTEIVRLCALGVKKFGKGRKDDHEDEADDVEGVGGKVAGESPNPAAASVPTVMATAVNEPTVYALPEGEVEVAASEPQQQRYAYAGSALQQQQQPPMNPAYIQEAVINVSQ